MEENNGMILADAVSKAAWCHNPNITDSRPTSGKYLFDKASAKKINAKYNVRFEGKIC